MERSPAESNPGEHRHGGISLRTRFLVVFVLIFLGGVIAGYGVLAWFSRDLVHTLGGWFAEKSVLYEKSKVVNGLIREIVLAQKLASSPALKAWARNEYDWETRKIAIAELEDYRRFYRSGSYFFAIVGSGNYYFHDERGAADPYVPRYTLDPATRKDAWFYATLDQVKDYALNVNTDRHLDTTKVWINAVVRDGDQPLAVFGTGFELSEFIRSIVSTADAGVTNILLDREGAIQAHQDVSVIDFASITKGDDDRSTVFNMIDEEAGRSALRAAMADLSADKSATRTLDVSIQGKPHVAAITYLPDLKWFLLTLTRPEAAESRNYVHIALIVLVVALALTLLAAGLVFDRLVLRRLAVLDAAARDVAAGRYGLAFRDARSDEIGRLAGTFQGMARRIAVHTEDLERQVAERTRDLERLAYADYQTGLLNRRGMMDRMEIERNRLVRHGGNLGVMLLDLDHFKRVNDAHGHEAGDRTLVHTAQLLRRALRSYDACARWGGEEFLAVVPGVRSTRELAMIAEKVKRWIKASPVALDSACIPITVSIGCCISRPDESVEAMLKAADAALYAAKQGGRDRVVVADIRELARNLA